MKKYKLWWLISTTLATVFFAEFVFYGIAGMPLFSPGSGSVFTRALLLSATGLVSIMTAAEGSHVIKSGV